ncbi:hypothetical protein Tco_0442965 [Tanacetum coccineum]
MTTLQFADTHNLVALLSKPAESEGFEQIFWATVKAKTVNGEVQLQALVDGKKIIITESIMRRDLQLEDVKGIDCLPNATIFEQLTLMGAKTTAWNEFSSTVASAIICLATNQKFNFSKYIFESMVKNLENVSGKFLMYPRFVQVFLEKQLEGMSNHKRIYVTPSHTKKIFRNMRRVGKGFSGRETPLFQTMVVQDQEEMGEGSANPTDPHHTPTIIQPSTSQPQKKQKPRRPKRKDIEIPQSSGPTNNVADEAVNEEMDDILERAATTATSLDAEQDRGGGPRRQETMGDTIAQTWSENVSKHSNDPLLTREKKRGSRTHKLKRLYKVSRSARMVSSNDASLGDQDNASKQGRKIDDIDKDAKITLIDETQGRYGDDLMFDTCVLDDEVVFAGQDMDEKEINVVEKEVSTGDKVTTTGEVVTTANLTKNTTTDDLTLAQTLIEIRSAKSKVKGVVIGEKSESTTRTRPQQLPSKDKGKGIIGEPEKPTNKKDQIRDDEEVAQRLQAQMQAELEEEDRLVRKREEEANIVYEKSKLFVQLLEARKKHFAAIRAKEKRNKPPTKAQKRNTMSTYLKNMAGYKHNQLKNKSFDDIQKLFDKAMKRVNTFVDMDTELVEGSEVRAEAEIAQESSSKRAGTELEQESIKKQKVDEDKETTELQRLIEVVPDKEEVAIDAIPLATKPPSIMYLVFSHMLKSFDREDLETLWKLVKAKHGSTRPEEGYERVLWGDLKTMFDPHVEDQVWRNQQDYRVLDWKIYDSCGVHSLRMQHMHIHMLVEKRYPLTPTTITDMLNKKLQCDHFSEMVYQLLKLLTK